MNIKLKLSMILLTLAMVLSNCTSTADDIMNEEPFETQYFHPPGWIQGKWQKDGTALYRFTSDDVIIISSGIESSFKVMIKQSSTSNTPKVNETITNTDYNFSIVSPQQNVEYKFKRINDNTIQWVNYPYTSTTGAFYLTRQ